MSENEPADGPDTAREDAVPPKRGRGRPRKVASAHDGPPVIKKYANRRLYDTASSRYVTLEDLAAMVREGTEFTVEDARDGSDITRSVLGQIIFEQEAKSGQSLLPTEFLRRVIALYGDGLGAMVPPYLEASMKAFARGQDEMRGELKRLGGAFDPTRMAGAKATGAMATPLKMIEEQTRRNAEMFTRALGMFTPFGAMPTGPGTAQGAGGRAGTAGNEPGRGADASPPGGQPRAAPAPEHGEASGEDAREAEMREMRDEMRRMQERMDKLAR